MNYPRRKSFGSKAMSGKQMRSQFMAWLACCRDDRLATPPSSLANMYGMRVSEIEQLIAVERARRGVSL